MLAPGAQLAPGAERGVGQRRFNVYYKVILYCYIIKFFRNFVEMILFKYPKGFVTPVFYLLKVFYTSHLVFKVINWVLYNLDNDEWLRWMIDVSEWNFH